MLVDGVFFATHATTQRWEEMNKQPKIKTMTILSTTAKYRTKFTLNLTKLMIKRDNTIQLIK